MDQLISVFSALNIREHAADHTRAAVIIQSLWRGYYHRKKHMPLVMHNLRRAVGAARAKHTLVLQQTSADGRINSALDECNVIALITAALGPERVRTPKTRAWYDLLVRDYRCGWLPVNIKISTMTTADNTGGLAACVYAYTDHPIKLQDDVLYSSGKMSAILVDKLRSGCWNRTLGRDYYYLVLEKGGKHRTVINSICGLTKLTPNANNLPFQIQWNKNLTYRYAPAHRAALIFIHCIKKTKQSWQAAFITNIHTMKLPGEVVPGEALPGEVVPGEALPREEVPEDMT